MKLPLRRYWTLLKHYLRPQQGRVILLAALLLSNIGLTLIEPQITSYFIDTALAGGDYNLLIYSALLFLGIALLIQLLTVCANYLSELVGWTTTNALRLDLLRHTLHLDQSFHKAHTPGELIERVDGDVDALSNFFSRFTVNLLGNAILLVGVLVLLCWEEWRVGLALTLFAAVALLFFVRARTIAVPIWTQQRQIVAEFFGFMGESLSSTEDIRANGAVDYILLRFYQLRRKWLPIQRNSYLAHVGLWMINVLAFALSNVITFSLGWWLWQRGAITIGTIYLIFRYNELLRQPLVQIRIHLADLQEAEAGMVRIEELLQTKSKLVEGAGVALPPGALAVDFVDVAFSYDEQESVLNEIAFHLQPGRVLGLLGRTGSGKSTLARLLLRLYDPSAGVIRLGGVDTAETKLHALRQRVGMVTQDVQLFQASVRDNLTFFNAAIADQRILTVLAELGLSDWLASLPAGLDSELSANGGGLSAGQAQLLAFARIFLTDPGLVILDEASSRLDPATEQLIEQAVSKLLHNRTAILIAHRLATVQRADEILILDKGRIVEQGQRAQLAEDPQSQFHNLLKVGLAEVLA